MRVTFSLIIVMGMFSCVTQESMTYLRGNEEASYTIPERNLYRLRAGDNISIEIESTDPASSKFYNLKEENYSGPYNLAFIYLNSHSVDREGKIKIPILGTFEVEGKSLEETTQIIEKRLESHLRNASVFVKLVSFEVTVLGEVDKPGNYVISDNEANLFRVLGMAGDLTDYGKRNKIKIVRKDNGTSKTIIVDLTDENILESEAYHLYPHDLVYVEPIKLKPVEMDLKPFGVLLSATTLVVLILRTVK